MMNTIDMFLQAIGTVTYTCQEFTGSAASSMGRPALVQTITPATFEVEVVGRITGTAPPAQSTTVSFKLSMTFDEPPSPDVKQEIFQSVAASTKSTLQTTAPGVAVEIYVREDAGRRRLATVSRDLQRAQAARLCVSPQLIGVWEGLGAGRPTFLCTCSQFSLNLLVDVVVSDPAAAGAVSAGVTGTNEAVLLDAIIDGIVNAPEGSALAAIAVSHAGF